MLLLETLIIIFEVFFILKFRSVLLQLILLVSFLPLVTMIAYINNLPVPGVLSIHKEIFTPQVLYTGLILLTLSNVILIKVLYPLRNQIYQYTPFKSTNFTYVCLLCILFLCAVISYPRVFGFDFGIDLSTIYISSNIALLICKRPRNNWGTIIHMIILFFVILGGDRVDSIVTIVFLGIMSNQKEVTTESIKKSYLIIGGSILFILSVISGIIRDGNSISIATILYSFYAQQTVADVLYVFLCSIGYFYEQGVNLSVLGNFLFGLFPGPFYGVVSEYNYTIFLIKNYLPNPGGGLFFSEGMIAWGPIGVLIYTTIYAICIKALFKSSKKILIALFILSFSMLCRIQWYGFIYAYKPILFTILFYLIFIHNIRNIKE